MFTHRGNTFRCCQTGSAALFNLLQNDYPNDSPSQLQIPKLYNISNSSTFYVHRFRFCLSGKLPSINPDLQLPGLLTREFLISELSPYLCLLRVLDLLNLVKRRDVLHPGSDDNCGVGSDVKTELPTFL